MGVPFIMEKGETMKLQLLVPHYKETLEEIKPLLDSIALQQGIDFNDIGMIICHDGNDIDGICHGYYPYKIEQIWQAHGGVSAARNSALDHATADYVMFCDSDDMFCSMIGLFFILREIESGFDCLTSVFTEQVRNETFMNREMDSTFVHGKVYRRAYLIENNIRFNPKLTIHEDSFFNILAMSLTDKAKYSQTAFYLWRWRDASVCRHDKDYMLKTYGNMIDSNDALVDEFIRRGHEDKATIYMGCFVFDAYYTMNKKEWTDKTHKEYRDAVERRFSDYFRKHKERWDSMDEHQKMEISDAVRSRVVKEGMPMESITIGEWLKHIYELR